MFWGILLSVFVLLGDTGEYAWKPTCQADQVSLWRDGRQIGVVNIQTGQYQAFENGKFHPADCPVLVPEQFGGPKPKPEKPAPVESNPAEKPLLGRVDPKPETARGGFGGFSAVVDGLVSGSILKQPAGKGEAAPEEKPPAEKPAAPINFGFDRSELPADGEFFAYNGQAIDKAAAEKLLFGGKVKTDELQDDSNALRLTVIGDDSATKKAIEGLKRADDWPELAKGLLLADYPPNHWAIEGKGYSAQPGAVSFYLTDPNGKLLYEGTDPGGLLDGLRRQKKPIGIDWNSWSIGISPFTWMVGLSFSSFHLPIEFVLLTIAGVVAGVIVLRKTKNPKGA